MLSRGDTWGRRLRSLLSQERVAALDGSGVHLRIHAGRMAGAAEFVDAVAEQVTVGAVLVGVTPELAVRFQRRCPQVVSLSATAASVPAVEAENGAGAYTAAVSHLHRVGRGRIAAIHGPGVNACASGRQDKPPGACARTWGQRVCERPESWSPRVDRGSRRFRHRRGRWVPARGRDDP
ncbi:hypothetical protein Aple_064970 [Acrocarpospora pleiomorpha]|uniref:Uncharacterized protein n=1 Tax=Acrocarpospora pleiomorpha TaxID=90975 RepID=A0A5M3XZ03_9ACTN|nr:hypothetical protein [Acrocarpospora pleiomorpha]GES23598.1 hypothetical protein Aple_064970 [Acrocarpospora pleiomorpha]